MFITSNMKRNLISFSVFDNKGFKFICGDSMIKILKGSLVVIKADLRKSNGLYYVLGTTISASATLVTPYNHLPDSHDKSVPKDLTKSKI